MEIKHFFKDKIILVLLAVALLLNLAIWAILFIKIKPSPLPIILHYNVYFGVDYLGKYTQAYIIPIIGLLVLIVNMILSCLVYPKSKLSVRILTITAAIAQILLMVSAITIILFNA